MKPQGALSFIMAIAAVTSTADIANAQCQCLPGAELPRVTDGTFALRVTESVDLTNSNVLLSFREVGQDWAGKYYNLHINGNEENARVGDRFNLKKYSSRLEGRSECWLDLYRLVEAKGAPVTASFRLDCP